MTGERFSNGSLDRWLKEQVQNPAEAALPDGWDLPSPQVWAGVRSGLNRRKKRRRRLVIWLFALLVAGLSGLFFLPKNAAISNGPVVRDESPAPTPTAASHTRAKTIMPESGTSGASGISIPRSRQFVLHRAAPPKLTTPLSPLPVVSLPKAVPVDSTERWRACPTVANRPTLPLPIDRPALGPSWTVHRRSSGRQWCVGVRGAMMFTGRRLQPASGSSATDRPNGDEHGAWTVQYGLATGLRLGRHWSVETGLQRTTLQIEAERRGRFAFRADNERFNSQRQLFENSASQRVQTFFGAVEMRYDFGREPGQSVADQEVIELLFQTKEQVHYLRLPLAARYTTGRNRWQWSAQAGAGLNVRTGYNLEVQAATTGRAGIRAVRARATRRAEGLADATADLQAGLEVGYRLTPGWTLRAGPEIQWGLTSLNQNGPFRSLAVATGFQVQASFQLPERGKLR